MIENGQLEQFILIKYLNDIVKYHHHYEKDDNPYTDLILINSENPKVALNRIINCNPDVYNLFSNLTTIQKAALMPKLEIFHRVNNSWKAINFRNFPDFNEFSNFATDVNTKFGFKENEKEDGVGIKQITIVDRNQNPGSVNLECTIELFFDNILALTNSSILKLIQTADNRGAASEREFRLKLVTGWSAPTDYSQKIFSPSELEIIEKSNSVYLLSLVKHDLTFNQNGSISLTILYQGAVEKYLASSSEMDIFGNATPEQVYKFLVDAGKDETGNLSKYIKASNDKYYYESLIDVLSKSKLTPTEQNNVANLGGDTPKNDSNTAKLEETDEKIEEAQEKLDEALKILAEIEMHIIKHKYARFLNALKNDKRLFFIPLNAHKYQFLLKALNSSSEEEREKAFNDIVIKPKNAVISSSVERTGVSTLIMRQIEAYTKQLADRRMKLSNLIPGFPLEYEIDRVEPVTNEELAEITTKILEENRYVTNEGALLYKDFSAQELKESSKFILYTTLGDIINTARQFINIPTEDNIEILIGPCNVGNVSINIASFPIAISTFMIWFVNTVIRQAKRKYQFWEFIYDIVNSLITPFLKLEGLVQKETVNVNLTKSVIISDQKLDKGKSYLDTNLYSYLSRNIFDTKNVYSYLALYVYDYELDKRDGILEDDKKDGIYHYNLARDRGIIKSIDFSKIDFPRLRDLRLTTEGFNNVGDILREHYDMTLKTIGSPLFVIGGQVYFDGAYLGESGKNITELLGLGGYYLVTKLDTTIAKDLYETTVGCTWTSMRKTAAEAYRMVGIGKQEPEK